MNPGLGQARVELVQIQNTFNVGGHQVGVVGNPTRYTESRWIIYPLTGAMKGDGASELSVLDPTGGAVVIAAHARGTCPRRSITEARSTTTVQDYPRWIGLSSCRFRVPVRGGRVLLPRVGPTRVARLVG